MAEAQLAFDFTTEGSENLIVFFLQEMRFMIWHQSFLNWVSIPSFVLENKIGETRRRKNITG